MGETQNPACMRHAIRAGEVHAGCSRVRAPVQLNGVHNAAKLGRHCELLACEPLPVAVLLFVKAQRALKVVLEREVQRLQQRE